MCTDPRARRPRRGFTLIEMIVAIIVLGVGLVGVMLALQTAARGSADPLVHKQMLAVAEEMLDEIELRPYAAAANTAPGGCSRLTFNDISDYDGYATSGQVCTIDGTPIPTLAGLSVSVRVQAGALGGIGAARRITVTVSRSDVSVTLVGWRTDYAS
jgi:MSHA pilin protein MshD